MVKTINFKLVTPAGVVAEHQTSSVKLPTMLGEITVLPSHQKLTSILAKGKIHVTTNAGLLQWEVHSGVVEVTNTDCTVLASEIVY